DSDALFSCTTLDQQYNTVSNFCIGVLKNLGNGIFSFDSVYDIYHQYAALKGDIDWKDIDGDNLSDIVIAQAMQHASCYLENLGNGNFAQPVTINDYGTKAVYLATGDLNNDNYPEIFPSTFVNL